MTAATILSPADLVRQQGWCRVPTTLSREQAMLCRTHLYGMSIACGVIAQGYNSNLPVIPFYTRVSVVKDVPQFTDALLGGPLMDAVKGLLGGNLCVTSTTLVIEEPGTVAGPWHTGERFDTCSQNVTQPLKHLMAGLMYSLFDEENGGLTVKVNGSPVTITGNVGDAVILDSSVPRQVAINDGDLARLGVYVGFTAAGDDVKSRPRDPASVINAGHRGRIPAAIRPWFEHWVPQ